MRGSALQDMTGLAREEKRRALPLPLHTLLLLCFRTNEETFIFKFVLIAAGVTEGAMHTSGWGLALSPSAGAASASDRRTDKYFQCRTNMT